MCPLLLQLRAIACLLLLVAMRFINLAVPILYKRVVDTLAAASAKHPAAAAGRAAEAARPGSAGILSAADA